MDSQLSKVSSTSSLPSLASLNSRASSGSIADMDAPASAAGPQEMSTSELSPAPAAEPFKSFRSLEPRGPFSPLSRKGKVPLHLVAAVALAGLCARATAEDADADDAGWTGEWNGEWTAPSDDVTYECEGDACNDDAAARNQGSMWLDGSDDDPTIDEIITYVSIGLMGFMTLLCCVCYPEILVVGCSKVCCCFGGKGVTREAAVDGGGDYVGGAQDDGKKKKKKKKRRSSSKGSGRSKSSGDKSTGDVELV